MIQTSKINSFRIQSHIRSIQESRFKRVCLQFPLFDKSLLQTRKKMIQIGDRFLQFYFLHYCTIYFQYLSVAQIKKLQFKFSQYLNKMAQIYGLVQYLKNSNKLFFTQNQLSSENVRDYFRLYIGCWYTLRKQIIKQHQRCHNGIDNELAPLLSGFIQKNIDIVKQQNNVLGQQFEPITYNQPEQSRQQFQKNYKNLLQQALQKKKQIIPKYTEGRFVNNGKVATIQCQVTFIWQGQKLLFKGLGSTKKQASFDAAKKGYMWVQGALQNISLKGTSSIKIVKS